MDPLSSLALLSAAFLAATLLHRLFARWGVPGILFELAIGFALGNWIARPEQVGSILGAAELGVLVLFCLVGLDTDPRGVLLFRGSVLRVAALSVTLSSLAFFLVRDVFGLPPGEPLLIAATLMTSGTGMAMHVLRERDLVATPSGKVLLGASVLDDFPAILLLACAFGAADPTPSGPRVSLQAWLLPTAAGLLVLLLLRHRDRLRLRPVHAMPLLLLAAWASHRFGLTSLLGALVVGMALRREGDHTLAAYLTPFAQFLIPFYFLTVGMRIPLAALQDPDSWILGGSLFALAFAGRLVCSLGVRAVDRLQGVDPWLVMWGMVPRGLPGLVFATLAFERGLLSRGSFFALVLMVSLTNLVGLAGLAWRARQHPRPGKIEGG